MAEKVWTEHSCDVCLALDSDSTRKRSYYCQMCQAWICEQDDGRLDRRLKAMVKLKRPSRQRGCNGCRERTEENAIPAFDSVQKKSVGQMSFEERLRYDLRLKSEAVMQWSAPLQKKRKQLLIYEEEYQRQLEQYKQQSGG